MDRAFPKSWVCRLAMVLVLGVTLPGGVRAHAGMAHGMRNLEYKHEVLLLEQQWRTAQLDGDVATMDRLLSDDYVGITMTGQVVTKAQQLNRVRTHEFVLTQLDLDGVKVKLLGDVAIVTVRAAVAGTNGGKSMRGNFRYTRIYQRVPGGGWKITNFEATSIPADGPKVRAVSKPS